MTSQPVEANVVLTADNSQYDAAMVSSSQSTSALGASLDSLGRKISSLSKTAGKTLIGISAADVATITGATAAWASYEKQMSRLQSQSAILTRTNDQQSRVMKDYTTAVKGLRTEYGTTTSEAAKLVEVLSKVTDMKQSRALTDLSKVFVDMSHATGESSEGLASSLTGLQKLMGSPINTANTRKYADMFTYLSAQTNTSASALVDFTATLAPIGNQMGFNQKQLAGFATAVTKSGQEGMAATTVFTKISTDISRSMTTGSSEIEKYARITGMTSREFKKLEGPEQVLQVMEALTKAGPKAINEMNRMGLDGPRTIRALSAITQQGGLRKQFGYAEEGYNSGAAKEGAEAAKGLNYELGKLSQSLQQVAESMGTILGPATEILVRGLTKVMHVVESITEGPMGKFLQLVMGVVAPLAAGAGALLLFAGTLLKVAAAFTLLRNSASLGVREGFRGGAGMTMGPDGRYIARGEGMLGRRGAQIAEGGTWFQRGMYNTGQPVGAALGGVTGMIRENYQRGRKWGDPNYEPGGAPSRYQRFRSWMDPYYERPERGLASYAAGGIGRGIQSFITPQYDQMRYENPAKRNQWLSQIAPWAASADQSRLGRQMGAVGLAEAQLKSQREETIRIHQDPNLSNAERQTKLDANRQLREETRERRTEAMNAEKTTREQIMATRENTREQRNTATGTRRLGQGLLGLGGGVIGAGYGGAKAGAGALLRSPLGMPIAGMAGTAALSAAGVQSNMLMGGAMGSALGPWGAAAGAGVGLGMDIAGANNDVTDSIKQLNVQAKEVSKSGVGLQGLQADVDKTGEKLADYQKQVENAKPHDIVTHPGFFFKNIFGSGADEMEEDSAKAVASMKSSETAVRDLAEAVGTPITGVDRKTQLAQLEDFMANEGAANLDKARISFEDLRKASEEGGTAYADMLAKIASPGGQDAEDLNARVRKTAAGRAMLDSPSGRKSMRLEGDVAAFYGATSDIFTSLRRQGLSTLDIIKSAERTQTRIGDPDSRQYELQMAVSSRAQQTLQQQMPLMTRGDAFAAQVGQLQAVASVRPQNEEQAAQLENTKNQTVQALTEQGQYFKQMLLMQEQFDLNKKRSDQDYNEQRAYALHDYNLQRSRSEEAFARQRGRATADYYRNVRRAQYDFTLNRERQEEDFRHQTEITAKQQAMSIMNIYQRVQTQRTASASWLLSNAGDQLTRMREQSTNLDRVRGAGLSTNAIQQLQLNSPENAQQLAQFVTEMTPQMIRQFNKTAGTERIKAARDLVTDESSLEWREMRRGYRLARERGAEDFQRQMRLSRQDFKRGLSQQDQDFDIMMTQQAEDYQQGMDRQEHAYARTMRRAAEDLANVGKEIDLSFEQILIRSTRKLSGHAQEQAKAVLASFTNLKSNTDPAAVAIMQSLAEIFGFEYTLPKSVARRVTPDLVAGNVASHQQQQSMELMGRASGGVIPGWTPGRDTTTVQVSGGEAIMRPEWTRAIGQKTVDMMNHQAKYGGFASGGVFWPVPGHRTGTYPGHDGVDINRGSGSDDMGDPIRAFRSGTITYVGSGHGYGDAIFERTAAGTVVYGHTSAQYVHAGQQVRGGQMIGAVGSTGNSSAPHLHFGIPGGTTSQALALLAGAMIGKFSGPNMAAGPGLAEVLKDNYPGAERAAHQMQGVHPLVPGDISAVINRYARRKVRQMSRRFGIPTGDAGTADFGARPNENMDNMSIVRTGANRLGWGDQWGSLRELVNHESGFNNTAQNPTSTAYGMFQFLNSTWAGVGGHKTSDPWLQTQYGLRYIKNRYGDPKGAWNFWQDHNWYKNGSVFTGAQTIGVGENGPEAVIPLNARGGEFMADVMAHTLGGRGTAAMGSGMSIYNTRVDRSTNFTGPITVQANDPAELIHKLQARQRVMALSRPSLTGSAA